MHDGRIAMKINNVVRCFDRLTSKAIQRVRTDPFDYAAGSYFFRLSSDGLCDCPTLRGSNPSSADSGATRIRISKSITAGPLRLFVQLRPGHPYLNKHTNIVIGAEKLLTANTPRRSPASARRHNRRLRRAPVPLWRVA